MTKNYCLITGSGAGLGKALAFSCARRKMNLLLIDLPNSRLHRMAEELRSRFNIAVIIFEFDLTDDVQLKKHLEHINRYYQLCFLINNAGVGGSMSMLDSSSGHIDKIIHLNIRTTVFLTHYLLPNLLNSREGYILNIGSMACFSPIAYKTVYPASKAFIASFSLGLREEMRNTGISVSVACPGPMMTNANTSQRILLQGFRARIGLHSTQYLAEYFIEETFKGKGTIVPGFWNRLNQGIMKLIPAELKVKWISRFVKHELKIAR